MAALSFSKRILVLSVAGVMLFGCGGAEERKVKYIQDGQAKFDSGDYEKARIGFKNALQIDPKDKDALFKLGVTQEKLQDWKNAAGIFQKLVDDHPDFDDAKIHLGQILLLAKEVKPASQQADEILARNENSVAALTLKAGTLAIDGKVDDGIGYIEKALKLAPDDIDGLIMASSLYRSKGNSDRAEQLLRHGMEMHPEKTDFIILLADVQQHKGNIDDTAKLIQQAMEIEPKVFAHRARLAQLYASQNNAEKVENILKQAIKDFPDDSKVTLVLVDYLLKKNKADDALQLLENARKEHPNDFDYAFSQADILIGQNKISDAKSLLNKIIESQDVKTAGLTARTKLAKVAMQEKNYPEAKALTQKVLKENASASDALLIRAMLEVNDKDITAATSDLRTVLRDQPQSLDANRLIIYCYLTSGQKDLAQEQLATGLKLIPNDIQMRMQYAALLAEKGLYPKAKEEFSAVISSNPFFAQAYIELAKVQIAAKEYDDARKTAEKIKEIQPEQIDSYALLAKLEQDQGNDAAAINYLKQALDKDPKSLGALTNLVAIYMKGKRYAEASELVGLTIKKDENNPSVFNLKGEVELAQQEFDLAEKSFKRAVELQPSWWTPYLNLSAIYSRQNRSADIINVLLDGVEKTAGAIPLRNSLAAEYEKQGKIDDAILQYEEIIKQTNSTPAAANNLAMLLVTYKQDSVSLDRALSLTENLKNSENPLFLDTIGWVHYKRGEVDQGLQYSKKAVEKAPKLALLRYHLALAQLKANDKIAAKAELENVIASGQSFPGLTDAKEVLKQLSGG